MAKSRCLIRCSLPAVVTSRRACVLGFPPCKANDPGIDDAATWQEMPKSIRRRERVERVVPVSMSRFLLSFVSKVSHARDKADYIIRSTVAQTTPSQPAVVVNNNNTNVNNGSSQEGGWPGSRGGHGAGYALLLAARCRRQGRPTRALSRPAAHAVCLVSARH